MSLFMPWAVLRRLNADKAGMRESRAQLHARFGRGKNGQNYTIGEMLSLDRSVGDAVWLLWIPLRLVYPKKDGEIHRLIVEAVLRAIRRARALYPLRCSEDLAVLAAEAWLGGGDIADKTVPWTETFVELRYVIAGYEVCQNATYLLDKCARIMSGGSIYDVVSREEEQAQMKDIREMVETLEMA